MATTRINGVSATATTFAGDDFLPIDGNVNATRRLLLTSLFASPSAIGSVTPAAGAFTTGTFSSTLNVTGVATLGNGAILGTPASGTVTNLTGTASININGTVGATTPSTIAATTISGTGATINTTTGQSLLTLSDGGVGSYSRLNMRGGGTNFAWSLGAQDITTNALTITPSTAVGGTTFTTPVATFTSTGLNSTVIGATTPAAGSFTTLGASGAATFTGGSFAVRATGFPASGAGIEMQYNAGSGFSELISYDRTGSAYKKFLYTASEHRFNVSATDRAVIDSTGLAVTGTLSATGNTTIGSGGTAFLTVTNTT